MSVLQHIPGLDLPAVAVTEKVRADPFTYEELSQMSTGKIILRWHSVEFESRVRARKVKMWVRILERRKNRRLEGGRATWNTAKTGKCLFDSWCLFESQSS
jgi:hypothetical protein